MNSIDMSLCRSPENHSNEPVGFFWKLKHTNGHKAYLLGSVHFNCGEMLKLTQKIIKYFQKSEALAVESNITRNEVIKYQNEAASKADLDMIGDLSKDDLRMISQIFQKMLPDLAKKLDYKILNEERFILCSIEQLKSQIFKILKISSGIDVELIRQAKLKSLPIEELETLVNFSKNPTRQPFFQNLFSKLVLEYIKQFPVDIDYSLVGEYVVSQIALHFKQEFREKIWIPSHTGNLCKMEIEGQDPASVDLTQQRNIKMAIKADTLMKSGKRYFIVIGADHTVGEGSFLTHLEKLGWSAKRVFV
jgi:uncharacterized protein YbaP (TraB family)